MATHHGHMGTMEGFNAAANLGEVDAGDLAAMLREAAEAVSRGERFSPILHQASQALAAHIGNDVSEYMGNIDLLTSFLDDDSSICKAWGINDKGKSKGDLLKFIALMSEAEEQWEQWKPNNPNPFTGENSDGLWFIHFLQSSQYNFPSKQCKRDLLVLGNPDKFWSRNHLTRMLILSSVVIGRDDEMKPITYAARQTKKGKQDETEAEQEDESE